MIKLENITNVFNGFTSHSDDYKGAMYINIYKNLPKAYYIYYDKNDELVYKLASNPFNAINETNAKIDEFYSDAYCDTPLAKEADKAFMVKGDRITDWKFK